jgi:hypothetical protein
MKIILCTQQYPPENYIPLRIICSTGTALRFLLRSVFCMELPNGCSNSIGVRIGTQVALRGYTFHGASFDINLTKIDRSVGEIQIIGVNSKFHTDASDIPKEICEFELNLS